MNNRIGPVNKVKLDHIDVMLVSAMSVVLASYALGYRLDWSETPVEEEEAVASEVAAPAALALIAPAGPRPTTIGPARPEAAWVPDPGDAAWEKMTAELGAHAAGHHGRVAVYLRDLKTNRTWSYHPDDLFPAASLVKVPVMASVFYKINAGELSLNDSLTLRRRYRVGGSGSLKWRPDGTKLKVSDLLVHMINESDNTATAMLLDSIGIGYAQQQFPKMGLLYTGIYPEGMSIKGGRVAHENYTTAREMTMLMEKIYHGEMVSKTSSTLMLEILRRKKATASRLAKGMPAGWEIAHKTGLLRMACHDSAIFLTPNGDYALTVLTGQNRDYHGAKDFITKLGKITFRHYAGQGRVLAKAGKRHNQIALR